MHLTHHTIPSIALSTQTTEKDITETQKYPTIEENKTLRPTSFRDFFKIRKTQF
jgi:hypothetical protein